MTLFHFIRQMNFLIIDKYMKINARVLLKFLNIRRILSHLSAFSNISMGQTEKSEDFPYRA